MGETNYVKKMYDSGRTVFGVADLGKIWEIDNDNYLRVLISRMLKRRVINLIVRGFYTCFNVWNRWELANKFKTPSYVSLESVLYKNGVIFQDYSKIITSVSNNSLRKKVAEVELVYSKIKDEILVNPVGIENINGVMVATLERAACDMIYLSSNFYFDKIDLWNKDLMKQISQIYNKRVIKEVEKLCSK